MHVGYIVRAQCSGIVCVCNVSVCLSCVLFEYIGKVLCDGVLCRYIVMVCWIWLLFEYIGMM